MTNNLQKALPLFFRSATNSKKRTISLKNHARNRMHLTQHVQNRAWLWCACRGQKTWPGIQRGRRMSVRGVNKRKMRQKIASSRRGTLSVEVVAG